jgi:hypothetical protein
LLASFFDRAIEPRPDGSIRIGRRVVVWLIVGWIDLFGIAGVAELVDALGLGSSDASCGGSSPSARTIYEFPRVSRLMNEGFERSCRLQIRSRKA